MILLFDTHFTTRLVFYLGYRYLYCNSFLPAKYFFVLITNELIGSYVSTCTCLMFVTAHCPGK